MKTIKRASNSGEISRLYVPCRAVKCPVVLNPPRETGGGGGSPISAKQVGSICIMDSIYINYVAYSTPLIRLGKSARQKLRRNEERLHSGFPPFFEVCVSLGVNVCICTKLHNCECQKEM